jgi:hypothetical protein
MGQRHRLQVGTTTTRHRFATCRIESCSSPQRCYHQRWSSLRLSTNVVPPNYLPPLFSSKAETDLLIILAPIGPHKYKLGGRNKGCLDCEDPPMETRTVVPKEPREAELRRLQLSPGLVRLSLGDLLHAAFQFSCLGPPDYSYSGAWCPRGPMLVPLWDCCDVVTAVWQRPDGLEFISFNIETPDEVRCIARTEQGLWLHAFDFLFESDLDEDDQALRDAAHAVGFRFLDLYLDERQAAEPKLATFEGKAAWLNALTVRVDATATA